MLLNTHLSYKQSRTKTRVDSRKEGGVVIKKVRGRVRQSTTTSTTETPYENETTKRTSTVTRSRTITSSRNNNRENTKERTNNNNENAEESKVSLINDCILISTCSYLNWIKLNCYYYYCYSHVSVFVKILNVLD